MQRVSTFSVHNSTVTRMTALQASMADAQRIIASGQKYDSFLGLGTNINRIQDLENSINGADRYRDNNTVAITRLNTMSESISQIQEVISQLSSDLVNENSPGGNVVDLAESARNALDIVESALNISQAGRSLFAGSKTNQPAVGDLRNISNLAGDTPTANYYQGDAFLASVQASDTLNVSYGITADDQAFQDAIGALHAAIRLEESGKQEDAVLAGDLKERALSGLRDIQTRLGSDVKALEGANKQHDIVQTKLNVAYSALVGNDTNALMEATIEASLNEATLTATLQTFARVSNLSLVDFLR